MGYKQMHVRYSAVKTRNSFLGPQDLMPVGRCGNVEHNNKVLSQSWKRKFFFLTKPTLSLSKLEEAKKEQREANGKTGHGTTQEKDRE